MCSSPRYPVQPCMDRELSGVASLSGFDLLTVLEWRKAEFCGLWQVGPSLWSPSGCSYLLRGISSRHWRVTQGSCAHGSGNSFWSCTMALTPHMPRSGPGCRVCHKSAEGKEGEKGQPPRRGLEEISIRAWSSGKLAEGRTEPLWRRRVWVERNRGGHLGQVAHKRPFLAGPRGPSGVLSLGGLWKVSWDA